MNRNQLDTEIRIVRCSSRKAGKRNTFSHKVIWGRDEVAAEIREIRAVSGVANLKVGNALIGGEPVEGKQGRGETGCVPAKLRALCVVGSRVVPAVGVSRPGIFGIAIATNAPGVFCYGTAGRIYDIARRR